jgi:1-deoxy-D-xylulose-5-phosphate reductoisomerase
LKRIAILGSTGSVGTQALEVVEDGGWNYCAPLLACRSNIDLLSGQIERFRPEAVAVTDEAACETIRHRHPDIDIYGGEEGLLEAIEKTDCDIVVNALVGIAGLKPTLMTIAKGGVTLALANKESLVTGGRIVMDAAEDAGVPIVPIDSEHSAVFQALAGNEGNRIRQILLTVSGGPFRGFTREQLEKVTLQEALTHPNWSMGSKITIDSATTMNKALEIIEAKWLYGLPADRINVVVHPQSIVHSFVEYDDGALMAQLGSPDMKVPISYALTQPERRNSGARRLTLDDMRTLTFGEPSAEAQRALDLAYAVLREIEETSKDSGAIALNGANEVLVELFMEGRIAFTDIVDTLERVLEEHEPSRALDIDDIIEIDKETRRKVCSLFTPS